MDVTYASVTTDDGFTVQSNSETAETMTANFAPEAADADETPAVEPGGADAAAEPAAPVAEPPDPLLEQNEDGSFKQKAKKGSHAELRQRIAKATWEREEAKRESDRYKAELETLRAERAKPEPPKPVAAALVEDGEPDPKKFPAEEYDPAYLKAYAKWEARQAVREAAAQRQQAEMQTAMQRDMDRVFAAGSKKFPTFEAELNAVTRAGLQFPPVLTDLILADPLGHDLAHEYATHLDDLRRLGSLSPVAAATAIGKVLARLEAPHSGSASPAPVLSQAKPPIQPVGSSLSAADNEPDDDEPLERHILRYNAADRKAGRR